MAYVAYILVNYCLSYSPDLPPYFHLVFPLTFLAYYCSKVIVGENKDSQRRVKRRVLKLSPDFDGWQLIGKFRGKGKNMEVKIWEKTCSISPQYVPDTAGKDHCKEMNEMTGLPKKTQ